MAATAGGPGWLRVGKKIELRSDEPGYSGAWFGVEIMQLYPARNEATVEYLDFVDEGPGAKRTSECAKVDNLRPRPPKHPVRKRWSVRDSVETLHTDAWWVGYIKASGATADSYCVYYGNGQVDLDIHVTNIRPRQNFVRPSPDYPNGSWSMARPMQDPAVWERTVVTTAKKKVVVTKRPVGKIEPRWTPAPDVGDASDDSWDEQDDRREKAKKRRKSAPVKPEPAKKSALVKPEPAKKRAPVKSEAAKKLIRIKPFDRKEKRLTITYALPAINPPPRVAEQSTLVLTPGSSPPLADSPFQDSADSQRQPRAPSRLATSSHSSSSESSGSSSSGDSDSDDKDDDDDDDDDDNDAVKSTEENVSIHGRMAAEEIFHGDNSTDARTGQNIQAYHQLLVCFRNSDKGAIDGVRREILKGIKAELKLSAEQCDQAHNQVFGMPGAFW